jgi:eukaryotic-like serine/threonine-protein kinase
VLATLVEEWWDTPKGADLDVVHRIHELLCNNADDEELFTREVHGLPQDLLDQYMTEASDLFFGMLEIYDRHVSGGLPFSYCDVVADFYVGIWHSCPTLRIRALILSRLIQIRGSTVDPLL